MWHWTCTMCSAITRFASSALPFCSSSKNVAMTGDDVLAHFLAPPGAENGFSDGFIDGVHDDLHDGVMSGFGDAAMEVHITLRAELSALKLLLLCDDHG